MRGLWAAVLASGAMAAHGAPLRQTFGAATVDFSAGHVAVAGAAAADLHAPNAAVARVRAERTARLVAARRLAGALAAIPRPHLGCRGALPALAAIEDAAARAPSQSIEWSSDGSVSLTLLIPLVNLTGERATADGGARETRADAVLLDPEAAPRWFVDRDGVCVAAPRFFETWDEARAALGGGVVLRHKTGAAGEGAVVAVVRHGADGGAARSAP